MNFVDGKIIDREEADVITGQLYQRICATLAAGSLDSETVVAAVDKLVAGLRLEDILALAEPFGLPVGQITAQFDAAKHAFSAEELHRRLAFELNLHDDRYITRPLGVLVHIAAGNAEGLPAFSVIEGLLAGNINILKLPKEEGGISIEILKALCDIEPRLEPYIYVFDYTSSDITKIGELVSVADAVVVWGGDEAVKALRKLTPPNTRIVEWGHKLSFGYITKEGATVENLRGFAQNIADTSQALCSSCQGIYVDSSSGLSAEAFAEMFLPILEETLQLLTADNVLWAKHTIEIVAQKLQAVFDGRRIFAGERGSVTVFDDSQLMAAAVFGNVWVKELPRSGIIETLKKHRSHLQTVGIACGDDELDALEDAFYKAGAVRCCHGCDMSNGFYSSVHDGEKSLLRYSKIVEKHQVTYRNLR
jgi:hypothetical protein